MGAKDTVTLISVDLSAFAASMDLKTAMPKVQNVGEVSQRLTQTKSGLCRHHCILDFHVNSHEIVRWCTNCNSNMFSQHLTSESR